MAQVGLCQLPDLTQRRQRAWDDFAVQHHRLEQTLAVRWFGLIGQLHDVLFEVADAVHLLDARPRALFARDFDLRVGTALIHVEDLLVDAAERGAFDVALDRARANAEAGADAV